MFGGKHDNDNTGDYDGIQQPSSDDSLTLRSFTFMRLRVGRSHVYAINAEHGIF